MTNPLLAADLETMKETMISKIVLTMLLSVAVPMVEEITLKASTVEVKTINTPKAVPIVEAHPTNKLLEIVSIVGKKAISGCLFTHIHL